MVMENLIGRKIKGFKFEDKSEFSYNRNMDTHIGEIGEIVYQNEKRVKIQFKDDSWSYPLPEALEYIIEEEEPIIPELGEGVEMEVSNDSINWYNRVVIAKYQDFYIGSNLTYWKRIRPIPVKKVTMEELEALVGGKFEIVNEK